MAIRTERLTIRNALLGGTSLLLLLGIGVVAGISLTSMYASVLREAQSRVDHDLATLLALYEDDLSGTAERFRFAVDRIESSGEGAVTAERLLAAREQLGFAVLNYCGPEGEPLAGAFGAPAERVPTQRDPVLRQALRGEFAAGTVQLSPQRMELEGGPALAQSQVVRPPGDASGGTEHALFQWFASPRLNEQGTVVGVLYGGRPLNHNYPLVDRFVETLFPEQQYQGKPVGTVTVFLDGVRVATNVRGRGGRRATGTLVSKVVRDEVLGSGRQWRDRAWVVDTWYLSGYAPLEDPAGETIGMLYVGLLEAPYRDLRRQMVVRFILPTVVLLLVGLAATFLVVRRITEPLDRLRKSADRLAGGDWDEKIAPGETYREISQLAAALRQMQEAIEERDRRLREQNQTLSETNDQLARANKNYMSMLGFVTHELKAPLANMQSLINLILGGYVGEVPTGSKDVLVRIRRNCEELQDMVKNYLDLSRAERGEMVAERRPIDFIADVVEPCLTQVESLFKSRSITLDVSRPETLPVTADPELMRIALTNYLTNAAKYGKEGGTASLVVERDEGDVAVHVWNEGAGFTAAEKEKLFSKFSRLQNENTKDKKGSGLGLFLSSQVLRQHGGRTWAESEPGHWARFNFQFPAEEGGSSEAGTG